MQVFVRAKICPDPLKRNLTLLLIRYNILEVKYKYMLFTGREVRSGKNCARGLEYYIVLVLETEGTVFPNTDRPRPVNNIFIYF